MVGRLGSPTPMTIESAIEEGTNRTCFWSSASPSVITTSVADLGSHWRAYSMASVIPSASLVVPASKAA